ncbi:hypothetical protein JTB14_036314 [Gonioctena quinquepunctata]|nr:hypothetical protein JTB14_036314 [Gonioctena quinquepunctata]
MDITLEALNICTEQEKLYRKHAKIAPSVTNGLLKSINEKNSMNKKLQKYPNNDHLRTEYRKYRNRLNVLIKKTKYNYYRKQIEHNNNNTKKLWEVVQEQKIRHPIGSIESEKGSLLVDSKHIAKEFNSRFAEMGRKLASKIKKDPNFVPNRSSVPNSLVLSPVEAVEIQNIINQLKDKKAVGIDNIRAETLKIISCYIQKPLTHIFNLCMKVGKYPSAFKHTVVIPLHKKASTSKITAALNESTPCLRIFVDLSKAFDTVSHVLLLQSLEDVGVRSICLELFESYLSDRTQAVSVDGVVSDAEKIDYGVQQGTILGPSLFNIYINGLFSLDRSGEIFGFADDTAIFHRSDNWDNLKQKAESDFYSIKKWFDYKLLTINMEKTNYLPFSCNSRGLPSLSKLDINMENAPFSIEPVKQIKYLGVIIDCHMRWDSHIMYVVKKLRSILYKFKKLKDNIPFNQMKTLYHSLVESHIRYGILAWGGALKTHLNPLGVLQRRFIKLIFSKNSRYSSDQLYSESKILDVRQLHFFITCLRHHDTKHLNQLPSHNYNTRKKKSLHTSVNGQSYNTENVPLLSTQVIQ